MKELKLIPPSDPRVQTAIAPFTDDVLKEHDIKDREELTKAMFACMQRFNGIGLTANQVKLRENIENSPVIVTLLTPKIGYLKSADLFKESLKTGKTIRELVVSKKLMTNKEVSSLLG